MAIAWKPFADPEMTKDLDRPLVDDVRTSGVRRTFMALDHKVPDPVPRQSHRQRKSGGPCSHDEDGHTVSGLDIFSPSLGATRSACGAGPLQPRANIGFGDRTRLYRYLYVLALAHETQPHLGWEVPLCQRSRWMTCWYSPACQRSTSRRHVFDVCAS